MDLAVMQVVRLKGMATPDAVAAATGRDESDTTAALAQLAADEHIQERKGRYRVTRDGRAKLDEQLAEERTGVDAQALGALYEDFEPLNSEMKDIANAWQMRDDEPNDHGDAAYDGQVIERLDGLHARFSDLVGRIVAVAPERMAPYPQRFDGAMEKIRGGDHSWFLKPLADSYHTVWFELHEDLIGLLGLSREDEAREGRA